MDWILDSWIDSLMVMMIVVMNVVVEVESDVSPGEIIDGDECFEYVLYIYCLFDFWYVLNCSIVVEYIVGVSMDS